MSVPIFSRSGFTPVVFFLLVLIKELKDFLNIVLELDAGLLFTATSSERLPFY